MLQLSIRRKVVITSLLAVVTSILLISVIGLNTNREIILEGTIDRELPAILGEVSSNIETQLVKPITVSENMASNPDYITFIKQGEPYAQSQDLTRYLQQINQQFGTFTAFYISSQSGNYYTHEGLFKNLDRSDSRDQWFYKFLKSGKTFELSLDVDEKSKTPTLFINYLIQDRGQVLGVAGVGLSLDSMTSSISHHQIHNSGLVYLVDGSGDIKIHPFADRVGKNIDAYSATVKAQLLNQQQFTLSEYVDQGLEQMVASRYLPDIGWYVVAQIPSNEVFAPVVEATWTIVLTGIVIALMFMLISTWLITRMIAPFTEIAEMLEQIGEGGGDLTQRLDESRKDESGQMARGYNKFVNYLADLLESISNTGTHLYQSVEKIDQQAKNMADKIGQQSSEIEQIATAIHQMGATAEEIAERASHAADNAQSATHAVSEGSQSVLKTVHSVSTMAQQLGVTSETISQLADDANSIDNVLEVIRDISEQTNLLALNAAIEAARAGDQGRGFSVVADEVRTLASRSHASTEEIRDIINNLQNKTRAVVKAISDSTYLGDDSRNEAENSGQQLHHISSSINLMNDMNLQIASATGQQSNVVNEINPHVVSIAGISRNNTSIVQQTSEDCSELKAQAEKLNQLVARFTF